MKDKRLRESFRKVSQKRLFLKAISCNNFLPIHTRKSAMDSLKLLHIHGTKIHNYCKITNRSKGVYRVFGIARSQFAILAGCGLLPGVKKSSW